MRPAPSPAPPPPDPADLDACRLVTVKELAALLHLSPRAIWTLAAKRRAGVNGFPLPISFGKRATRWRLREVRTYLDALASEGAR
ncbi:MAG: hypothetical protein FJ290_14755 [Planctomycetes bacterium]|nr:hypothetical protein [Planctomycetota bacterium]